MTNKFSSIKKLYIVLFLCFVTVFCLTLAFVNVRAEDKPISEVYINVDFGNYDGREGGKYLPHGKEGKTYPVFPCSAVDDNGKSAERILITVTDGSGKLVPQVNGRFSTAEAGTYKIEYLAVSGSVSAKKTLEITVDEYKEDDIKYTADIENVPTNGVTGSAVFVVFGNFSGGTGDLTEFVSIKLGDEEIQVIETSDGAYFIPEKEGVYSLEFGVVDFTGDKKSVAKIIKITDSDMPVLDKPFIPDSAVEGETLALPHADGLFYKNGKKYYLPVKVTFDGTDVSATLKVENLSAGEHTIEYVCKSPLDDTKSVKRSFPLNVKEKEIVSDRESFAGDFTLSGCSRNTDDDKAYSVLIKAIDGENVNASISYGKALSADALDMEVKVESVKRGETDLYSKVYFVIKDANGKTVKADVTDFAKRGTFYAGLSYDSASNTYKVINKNNSKDEGVVIDKYTDDNPFKGFSSTAFVSMQFESVVKDVKVTVNKVGSTVVNGARVYDKYFDFENCTPSTSAKNVYTVTAKATGTKFDASISFSRSLPINYIDMEIGVQSSFGAYTGAYLTITDSKNASERIRVRISGLSSYEKMWLSYDEGTQSIVNKNNGATIVKIETYENGTKFNGFTSGKANVSFSIKDVVKDVIMSVHKAGSTNVTTASVDTTPPEFNENAGFRTVYVSYLGHIVNLPKLTAFDILDKNVTVTLAVTKPDGTLVYEGTDGYALAITESGEYSIEYTATDSAGNIRKKISSVYVTDLVSPVISVNGVEQTVKVGDEITLPKATITDNDTPQDKILSYVYVVKGNNRKQIVGDTYKFTTAGEYKIRYVAYDANQNYTVVEFTVVCK